MPNENTSNQALPRKQQFEALSADKPNTPVRIRSGFYLVLLGITIVQVLMAWTLWDMYSQSNDQKKMQIDLDTDIEWFTEGGKSKGKKAGSQKNTFQDQNPPEVKSKSKTTDYFIFTVIYLICSAVAYSQSSLKDYLQNSRNVSELIDSYNQIKNYNTNLQFKIQCYHTVTTGFGKRKKTKKVVTHQANQLVQFSQSYDFCGFLSPDFVRGFKKPIIFVDFKAECSMIDEKENDIVEQMYADFISENTIDDKQSPQKIYVFNELGIKTSQSYLLEGETSNLNTLLMIASVLMLIWPASMILDYFYIEKYEITMVKKVKLDENQPGYQKSAKIISGK